MKKFELYIQKVTVRRSKKTLAMSTITRNKRSFKISDENPSSKRKYSCSNSQTDEIITPFPQKSSEGKNFLPRIHQRSISMATENQVKEESNTASQKKINVKSLRNHSLHSVKKELRKSQSTLNTDRSMNLKDYLFLSDRHLHQLSEFINNKNKITTPIADFHVLQKVDKLADDFQFQNNKQKNKNGEKESLNQTTWKEIKFSNQKPVAERKSHTLVVHADYLYLYGGCNNLCYLDDFYRCQIQPNNEHWRWEKIHSVNEKPGSLSNHTAVVYEDSIYFYGGQINTFERSDSFYKFSIKNKKWEQISKENQGVWPGKLDSHSAQIYENQMIIFGGVKYEQSEIIYTNDMYMYSFESQRFTQYENRKSQVPSGRCSHSTAVVGDVMYLFGGNKESKRLNDFWIYNFKNQIWTQVDVQSSQLQPPKISGATMSSYKDLLIIFGGLKSIMYENPDIFLYCLKTQKWKQVEQNLHQEQFDFIIQPNLSRVTSVNGEKRKFTNQNRKSILDKLVQNQKQRLYDKSIVQDSSIIKSNILDPQKSEIKLSKMESYKKAQFLKIFETKNDGSRNVNSPTTESLKKSIIMLQRQGNSKEVESQDQRALDQVSFQVNFMVMGDIRKKHPVARDNHQAVIFQDRLFIFGGDRHKMAFNDMFELDLNLPNNKFSLQV